jgi:hypothetical protein
MSHEAKMLAAFELPSRQEVKKRYNIPRHSENVSQKHGWIWGEA